MIAVLELLVNKTFKTKKYWENSGKIKYKNDRNRDEIKKHLHKCFLSAGSNLQSLITIILYNLVN